MSVDTKVAVMTGRSLECSICGVSTGQSEVVLEEDAVHALRGGAGPGCRARHCRP